MRAHKGHKLIGGTRADKVCKSCWHVGGTSGTRVLLLHPLLWGVPRLTCCGQCVMGDMPWP